MGLYYAIAKASRDCVSEGILADFLESHSSEVTNMLITEWNSEQARRADREEGLEEGIAIGEVRGEATTTQIIKMFMQKKTPEEISAVLGVPMEKVIDILRKSGLMEQAQ